VKRESKFLFFAIKCKILPIPSAARQWPRRAEFDFFGALAKFYPKATESENLL